LTKTNIKRIIIIEYKDAYFLIPFNEVRLTLRG